VIRAVLVAATALALAGCTPGPAAVAGPPAPILSRQDGERLLLQADAALATAYRDARPDGLPPVFGGAALGFEQRRVDEQGRRGESRQEHDVKRRVVHWSAGPGGGEGVLELSPTTATVYGDERYADRLEDPSPAGRARARRLMEGTKAEAIEWLSGNDFTVYLADTEQSANYRGCDYSGRTALVVGSERYGISAAWYEPGFGRIGIPMLGAADSLNVAVSASVLLYEARARKNGW